MTAAGILHRGEVGGIPAFWVETGRPTLTAALVFRAGISDGEPRTHGLLHLAEHLMLHDLDRGALSVNGQVSLTETVLSFSGPPSEVVDAVSAACTRLAWPDEQLLAAEARVLEAEEEYRSHGAGNLAMLWRYGIGGPGLAGCREWGLHLATPQTLTAVRDRLLTRGNAALVFDGPPPAGLKVSLPDGPRVALGLAVPLDQPTPFSYDETSGLLLSGVVQRHHAALVAAAILERHMTAVLREADGSAYAPHTSYLPVDIEHGVIFGASDLAQRVLPTAAERAWTMVRQLQQSPPPDAWVAEAIARSVAAVEDPYATLGLAFGAGSRHLEGRTYPTSVAEAAAERRAVTVADVHAALADFVATLGIALDGDAPRPDDFPPQPRARLMPLDSHLAHRSVDFPRVTERVVLSTAPGREFFQVGSRDSALTLPLPDLAVMLAGADGRRHLLTRDGFGFPVEPTLWRDGPDLVRRLDAAVDPALVIPIPGRDPADIPQQDPAALRLRWAVRRGWRAGLALLVTLAAVVVVTTLALTGRLRAGEVAVISVAGVWCVYEFARLRRQLD